MSNVQDRFSGQASGRADPESAELEYLAGLRTPTEVGGGQGPARKQRVIMVEVSSGSGDMPRRTIRVPLDDNDVARVGLKLWLETEEDQDGVATQQLPGAGPRGPTAMDTQLDKGDDSGGLSEEELAGMVSAAMTGGYTDDAIRLEWGEGVLRMVQTQRALLLDSQSQSQQGTEAANGADEGEPRCTVGRRSNEGDE